MTILVPVPSIGVAYERVGYRWSRGPTRLGYRLLRFDSCPRRQAGIPRPPLCPHMADVAQSAEHIIPLAVPCLRVDDTGPIVEGYRLSRVGSRVRVPSSAPLVDTVGEIGLTM